MWVPATPSDAAETLAETGLAPWLAGLLARRGVLTSEEADRFLQPSLDQLHDPRELASLPEAVTRLVAARDAGERVALVGDYDVDGVSGTALLTAVLGACGIDVHPIIPHRMRDGYGFQPVHVQEAQDHKCRLIVTVDCGTTSIAAAEAARAADLDVIITDHHLPGESLPDGVLLINPQRPDCSYPFTELSGAGLALKLATAVADACGKSIPLRQLLRIACLGTIADLVPLRDENRVIAAIGLEELEQTRSPGLRALFQTAGLRRPYTTQDVGFRIGPRLNAPGRLDSANKALELLLSRDPKRAKVLAEELDGWNRERQGRERQVVEQARGLFADRDPLPWILVGWHEDWHRGVVGIAAGKLAREFHRPTILLAVEDNTATGSGRSVPGIHLHEFLDQWHEQLPRFGGHAQAIGLTVECEQLEHLCAEWEQQASEMWHELLAEKRLEYELSFDAGEVTPALLAELDRLEPHGMSNRQPLMRVRGPLELTTRPRVFGNGHLSGHCRGPDGGMLRLLGWSWAERSEVFERPFEVLGRLEADHYRGGVVLRLVDVRPYAKEQPRPLENIEPTSP